MHPDGTPYNEVFFHCNFSLRNLHKAWDMRDYLVNNLSFPIEKVVIEPYARHSDRNLRNAGRFMLVITLKVLFCSHLTDLQYNQCSCCV